MDTYMNDTSKIKEHQQLLTFRESARARESKALGEAMPMVLVVPRYD
jgi:hypothetical protein